MSLQECSRVGICAAAAGHYDTRMPKQRNRARVVLLVTGILAVVFVAAVVRYRDELVAWYEFHRDFERLAVNAQGRPEYRHRETGIVFVSLPGGTFAQAMVNDSNPDEVLNKVWEFIDKYENEGGTLELAVGNIDDTVCAPSAPEGCPGGGGIF